MFFGFLVCVCLFVSVLTDINPTKGNAIQPMRRARGRNRNELCFLIIMYIISVFCLCFVCVYVCLAGHVCTNVIVYISFPACVPLAIIIIYPVLFYFHADLKVGLLLFLQYVSRSTVFGLLFIPSCSNPFLRVDVPSACLNARSARPSAWRVLSCTLACLLASRHVVLGEHANMLAGQATQVCVRPHVSTCLYSVEDVSR